MTEIENSLKDTKFGIICVTPENVDRPWLNYEAGALSKQVDEGPNRVIPLLFDFADPADVNTPVGQFQAVLPTKDGFERIALSLNAVLPVEFQRLPDEVKATNNMLWGPLEQRLGEMPVLKGNVKSPRRTTEDMMREIVNTVRELDAKVEKIANTRMVDPNPRLNVPRRHASDFEDGPILEPAPRRDLPPAAMVVDTIVSIAPDLTPGDIRVSAMRGMLRIGTARPLSSEERDDIRDLFESRWPEPQIFRFGLLKRNSESKI